MTSVLRSATWVNGTLSLRAEEYTSNTRLRGGPSSIWPGGWNGSFWAESDHRKDFIVNLGTAKASQIVSLIGMMQERVYVKEKKKLETKVLIVGDWQSAKLRIQE